MVYKPPGTYARFVKTASPVANAGNSRIMALVGTGINYYTVNNEAVTKSKTKPYDELKNSNIFEILNVSSRPIYNNLITSDNVIYKTSSEANRGYKVSDNIISWDSLVRASVEIDASFCPDFVTIRSTSEVVTDNITYSIDESANVPVEDGEWMIEVSYINEDDVTLGEGNKLGCYRIINTLTGEIVGEYVVSPDPVTNEDGSYPIPGVRLVVHDTYLTDVIDGLRSEQKVFVGDYVKIKTVAAKTEVEAKAYKQLAKSTDMNDESDIYTNFNLAVSATKTGSPITSVNLTWNDIIGDNDKYKVYVKTSEFSTNDNGEYVTSDALLSTDVKGLSYTLDQDTILSIMNIEDKMNKKYTFTINKIEVDDNDNDPSTKKYEYTLSPDTSTDVKYAYKFNDAATYTEFTTSIKIPEDTTSIGVIAYGSKIGDNYYDKYTASVSGNVADFEYVDNKLSLIAEAADIADLNDLIYNENTNFYFLVNSIDANGNVVDFALADTAPGATVDGEGGTSGEGGTLTDAENDEAPANASDGSSSTPTAASDASLLALYNAIDNVVIVNNDSLYEKTAVYIVEYTTGGQFKITRVVDGAPDDTFQTVIVDQDEDMFDVIPGVSFDVDVASLVNVENGSKLYIVTSPRVTSNDIPSEGSTYYVSYKYRKSEADYEPKLFTDYDDIVATYGNYDVSASSAVLNSLSLGAEIAYNNGVSQIVCVQAKNNSDYEMQLGIDKLTKVIAGANNVNTIIPLTNSDVVGAYLKNHVDLMSSYEYGKERMGYLAGKINQPINKIATKNDRSLGLTSVAEGYNDERIVYVVPGAIKKQIRDLRTGKYNERVLPGCYAAVAVAAIGLANDPAEPLTNKTIAGFTELVNLYSESEKNMLASAGCCVLEPSGTTIKIRHGITTNNDEVNSQEITLIQIKDYVIDACRTNTASLYVGRKLVASIISDVKYTIESMLNQFISQGVIISYSSLKVKRNSEEPRQIDVSFEIEAVYPLNWISIEFGFSETSF